VEICHPNLNVSFIQVDNYNEKGSSLLYSMLKAKDLLNSPFVFHASDTIIKNKFNDLSTNYIVGFPKGDTSSYCSYNVDGENIIAIFNKGEINPDFIHIGVIFIKEYKEFWKRATQIYDNNKYLSSLNDVSVINKMIMDGFQFKHAEADYWFDSGSVKGLKAARKAFPSKILNEVLDKEEENIYYYKNKVVKFFKDENIAKNRINRALSLFNVIPEVDSSSENFYSYKYQEGQVFSKIANPSNFKNFLDYFNNNLWENKVFDDLDLEALCKDFYLEKSLQRIQSLLNKYKITDKECQINGIKVPPVFELLKLIPMSIFSKNIKTRIHGDFILDNCIFHNDKYTMIDWRQDFSGELEYGDLYYDLSKLAHNIVVNHEIINKDLFTYSNQNGIINVDILCKKSLIDCEQILFNWSSEQNFSVKKIKILRALIWLNMAPLHHHPFDTFLYYFGKLNLYNSINEKN
jgi:hypothetical protein